MLCYNVTMQTDTKTVVYPAVRFTPDKDEKGVFILDPRTKEFKSGVLEVTLFETHKNGDAHFLAGFKEDVSYTKYKAIREEIDHLTVDQLRAHFPQLAPNEVTADDMAAESAEESATAALEKQVADLTKALEKANAKTATPKSTKAAGKANGKSGAKKTEQKSSSPDKADAEK